MSNVNYDSLLATTLANHAPKLVDNIFQSRVLLWWLTEKNKVDKKGGGHKIVTPLIYAQGSAGSYGEWDAITIAPQDGLTAAEFAWKQLQAGIAISGLEEAQNSGDEAVINLLEAKVMQAEETLKESLNVMLFGDGTGNSSKDFGGLALLVNDESGSLDTVGGINCATAGNEYWRSTVLDKTAVVLANVDTQAWFTNATNSSSKGNDVTDGIFTSQLVFELHEASLLPQARFVNKTAVDAGFTNLLHKGCPIYWDFEAPAGTAFGLNSKYIKLVGHKDRWFKQSPFSQGLSSATGGNGTVVDARYALITTYGNLTVSNRKRQWKIHNIATS
jgi:hypothetical protein